MSVIASIFIFCFLFAIQGFLLQTSVALTGDPAPRYGAALFTSIIAMVVASVGALMWGCTFGLILWFVNQTLAAAAAGFVGLALTAAVYRSRLSLNGVQALVVAGLHQLMAWGLAAALWKVYDLIP